MFKKVKRIVSLFLTLCVLLSCFAVGSFTTQAATSASGVDYNLSDNIQQSNILHCWNWSYNNIRVNLKRIAEQGFSAIQISPVSTLKESLNESWSTVNNQWWVVYQPLGFAVENSGRGFGSIDELKSMCNEAHKFGIKVIVDVVFNHLANDYGHEGTIHPFVDEVFRNNTDLWHQPLNYQISNYNDRYDITHHSLSALPDLNTGHSTVQTYAADYLKELISYGVDGFRFDAAKHIETPTDAEGTKSEFWYNVLGTATSYAQSKRGFTPYYYGELLDNTGGVDIGAYTYYMSVTDNGTSSNVRNGVLNGYASSAAQSYTNNGAAPNKTVLWNESHDEYIRSSDYTRSIDGSQMNKIWSMIGSRNECAGLYLARPYDPSSTMIGEADATEWSSKTVQAINQFKNHFKGQSEYMAHSGNFAYNVRGGAGVVIVNTGQSNTSATVNIPACTMVDGTYEEVITGNQFTVSNGYISGKIGSTGVGVVYNKGPQASVYPESTAYRSSTLTLTLHTEYADYGLYSFDNKNFYEYTDGQKITIGADDSVGDTTTLYIQSVNMWGQYSNLECFYYWKLSSTQEQKLYFNNSNFGYTTPYAYFYSEENTDAVAKSWPGYAMSIDENTDMPYIDVPKGYECANVIINNGSNGGQNPKSGPGYKLNGNTSIIDNDYLWDYTPVTTEGLSGDLYLKTNNWGNDDAQLMAYVWTGDSNALAYFELIGDNVYKATLPKGVWKRVNFLRVAADATSENIWDNVWNQGAHMIPTGQNFFTMYDDTWDGSGSWGVYDATSGDASVSLSGDFNGWSLSSNVMNANSSGNYTTTVTLNAGTYLFKVVQGGLWYGSNEIIADTANEVVLSMTAGECTLEATGGTYTFTYNASTRTLSVSFVAAPTTSQPDIGGASGYTIAGDFNDWSSTSDVMMYTDNTDIVTATMELEAGAYLFKIVEEGVLWYGYETTVQDEASGITLSNTGGNVTLKASGGTYTFTYNLKTRAIDITCIPSASPEVGTISEMSLSGDFNGWSTTSDMMVYSADYVVSTTMTIDAGTYYFKVVDTNVGLWYGCGGTIPNTVTATTLSPTASECILEATGGEYTFNYNVRTKVLSIECIEAEGPAIGDVSNASVAGEFNSWDYSADKMIYTAENIVSTTITLSKGTYQFKIVSDSLWYGNEGTISNTTNNLSMEMTAGNCTLVASGGDYTFKYNVATNKLTITFVASNEVQVGDTSTASLAGDFNNWSTTADMLVHTSSSEASKTLTLNKGTYYFKVVNEGLWYGNNGTIVNTTLATSNVGWEMSIYDGECILEATGGTYTFTFNLETNMLVVDYEAPDVVIGAQSAVALSGSFNEWSTTSEKMVYASTSTVKTTVSLSAGSYQFKIVNGYWYGNDITITDTVSSTTLSATAGNVTLQATGGDYTFVYDIIENTLKITFVKAEGPEIGSTSNISVAGDFNDWDKTASKMKYASEKVVTTTLDLPKGTYWFKIVNNSSGLWFGNNGTIANTTTDTSSVGWEMSMYDGNCCLEASGGTYTFNYNITNNYLVITYTVSENSNEPEIGDVSTVSLAGSFNDWDTKSNVMTYKSSDIVTTTVTLTSGIYQFKLVDDLWYGNDGTIEDTTTSTSSVGWEMSSTAGDCTLTASGGTYTFDYNITSKMLIVTFEADESQGPVLSNVALAGDFNGWSSSAEMMSIESGQLVTITKTFSAGTHEFKIVDGGAWYGNDGTVEDTTTKTSAVGWEMSSTSGNCKLVATGGSYTFKYNKSTKMLVITKN